MCGSCHVSMMQGKRERVLYSIALSRSKALKYQKHGRKHCIASSSRCHFQPKCPQVWGLEWALCPRFLSLNRPSHFVVSAYACPILTTLRDNRKNLWVLPPPSPFKPAVLNSGWKLESSGEMLKPQRPGHIPDQLNPGLWGRDPSISILEIPLVSPVCGQVESHLFKSRAYTPTTSFIRLSHSRPLPTCPNRPTTRYSTTRDRPYALDPAAVIQTSQSSACLPCLTFSFPWKPQ